MVVQSVQEFISYIENLTVNYTYEVPHPVNPMFGNIVFSPHFIFRGHSKNQYLLLPQLFRWRNLPDGKLIPEFRQVEYNILSDFISEARRFVTNVSEGDVLAWLEIAQHFGVPTRLLDFTENPLVALYFACIGSPNSDASVWIVNEPAYNKKYFSQSTVIQATTSQSVVSKIVNDEIIWQNYQQHAGNPNYIQFPWIYKPQYREERMNSQSSIFMLWGADLRPLTALVSEEDDYMVDGKVRNADKGFICCIDIPAYSKISLLKQLDQCGINEKYIYPGVDGVGRFINKKYSSRN